MKLIGVIFFLNYARGQSNKQTQMHYPALPSGSKGKYHITMKINSKYMIVFGNKNTTKYMSTGQNFTETSLDIKTLEAEITHLYNNSH